MNKMLFLAVTLASVLCVEGNDGLDVSFLNLKPQNNEGARINFGEGSTSYSMGVNAGGDFTIEMDDNPVFAVSDTGMATLESVKATSVTTSELIVNGVPQWRMIAMDTFAPAPSSQAPTSSPSNTQSGLDTTVIDDESTPEATTNTEEAVFLEVAEEVNVESDADWNKNKILSCAGLGILLAGSKDDELSKTYQVPANSQVRIVATVHFVDDWAGETAYLKINGEIVWTRSHDQGNSAGKFNVCGSERYPESLFSVPIDITVNNSSSESTTVSFGTNLEDFTEGYFGTSAVSVYVRSTGE